MVIYLLPIVRFPGLGLQLLSASTQGSVGACGGRGSDTFGGGASEAFRTRGSGNLSGRSSGAFEGLGVGAFEG